MSSHGAVIEAGDGILAGKVRNATAIIAKAIKIYLIGIVLDCLRGMVCYFLNFIAPINPERATMNSAPIRGIM